MGGGGLNPLNWNYSNFPGGRLGAGLLGLTALGDVGGLVSNYFREQQMRDIYKKATDPNWRAAQSQAYADPLFKTVGPRIQEQTGGYLGQAGISQGAYGQKLMEQALADAYANLYTQGGNLAMQGLGTAGGAVRAPVGSGGTGQALQSLLLLKALQGQQPTPSWGESQGYTGAYGSYPQEQWGQMLQRLFQRQAQGQSTPAFTEDFGGAGLTLGGTGY